MDWNRKYFGVMLLALASLFGCDPKEKSVSMNKALPNAPIADKQDSAITFHNHTRLDPYFWMRLTDDQKRAENPDAQTQKVLQYLEDENAYTKKYLSDTEELQGQLYDEIVGRLSKKDESVPYFKNGYWYYSKYEDGKEYKIYCRKQGSLEAEEEILLDINELAKGSAYYAAVGLNVSPDNKILAFGEDTLSRRIYTIRFLNLETGEFLPDQLVNSTGSGSWGNDNKTYFYTTKNKVSLLSEKIWRHDLGSDKDLLVYDEKDPTNYIGVYKSKSDKYVIIYSNSTLSSKYLILDADQPKGEFKEFTPREEVHEYAINHFEDKFYILTNWDALNFRLMETSVSATEKQNWKEVIAHRDDVLLTKLDIFSDYLVLSERSNGLNQIRIINQKNNEEHYMEFDEPAYIARTSTNVDFNTNKLRFIYSSLTTPYSTIDYDMDAKTKDVKKVDEVVGGHNPADYETKRFFVTARDGAQVPVSIVYKKGYEQDGNAPLLLYAYGSYGSTIDPSFRSSRLSLLDRGFAFAIAHIRGGQAMGRQWYEDGKMFKKKNTFTDFIDCANYLIDEKYTSANHLYAQGGSAGGLLMGAIVNMSPETFNGVIAAVPFVDVVNTMLDETIPLTTNEFDEWGNPKNKLSYEYMLSYSPYDQVKAQNYPSMLVTTGLFDSQVQYWEPAKWVAKLRDMKTDDNILLLETNMDAGHGGASGRFKQYKETALEYAFLMKLEGMLSE